MPQRNSWSRRLLLGRRAWDEWDEKDGDEQEDAAELAKPRRRRAAVTVAFAALFCAGASLSALAVLCALLAGPPARAADETAAAFFQGKQVRFYTMGSPGGGYDAYMRALIPHLEKKLGAKMLPTNEPGAGGLIAINRTINAPPDGLTMP